MSDLSLVEEIELETRDVDPNEAAAFAALFRKVWTKLPGGFCRSIVLYWQTGPRPQIGLAPFEGYEAVIAGEVQKKGRSVVFNRFVTDQVDDNLLEAAIVHELSHVFWIATDQVDHSFINSKGKVSEAEFRSEEFRKKRAAAKIATELLAHQMTRRLGFPQDEFYSFLTLNVSKEFATREEMLNAWEAMTKRWSDYQSRAVCLTSFSESYLHREHESYYQVAFDASRFDSWADIEQVRNLI